MNSAYILETADAVLRENGISPERDTLLTSGGKILTSLTVRDYSTGFYDTFKKCVSLLPFVRVRQSYSHTIKIEAI